MFERDFGFCETTILDKLALVMQKTEKKDYLCSTKKKEELAKVPRLII